MVTYNSQITPERAKKLDKAIRNNASVFHEWPKG